MANFDIIRDLAEKRRITIRNLALRVGITPGQMQEIMKKGRTNTTTAEKIASELGVPVGIFFDGEVPAGSDVPGRANAGGSSITVERKGDTFKDEKIKLLQEIIAEKERLISVLMKTEQNTNI